MIFSYRFKPSSSSCVCYNPAIHQVLSHVLTCVSNCSVFLHTHHLCCHYPRLDFHHLSSGWLLQSPNQSAVFSVHSETAARMVCLKYKIEHSGPYLKHFDSSKLSSGLNPDSSQGSSWASLSSSPHFYSQYFSVRLCGLIILKNFPSLKVAFCFSYLGFCLCRSLFLQHSSPYFYLTNSFILKAPDSKWLSSESVSWPSTSRINALLSPFWLLVWEHLSHCVITAGIMLE